MANSSEEDKFGSLIIPNCRLPTSQDEDDPFPTGSKVFIDDDDDDTSSSEIEIITLSETSDEYHTPPSSQNSPNNSSAFDPIPVDDDNDESPTVDFAEECGGVLGDTINDTHMVDKNEIGVTKSAGKALETEAVKQKQESGCSQNDDFISLVNRASKMLKESKKSSGSGSGDDDLDLIETANMAGWLSLVRDVGQKITKIRKIY